MPFKTLLFHKKGQLINHDNVDDNMFRAKKKAFRQSYVSNARGQSSTDLLHQSPSPPV